MGRIFASFWHPFGIDFLRNFIINFWIPFWTPFSRFWTENCRQKGTESDCSFRGFWAFVAPRAIQKTHLRCTRDFLVFLHRLGVTFSDLLPKVVAKVTQIHPPRVLYWQKCTPNATKTHLRRNLEFCIDFVSISVPFSTNFRCFWASFFMKFWLVRRFRCFPNTLSLNLIRRSPLGVRRSTLCVYNTTFA